MGWFSSTIDGLAETVSPQWAVKRERARKALEICRGYDAAGRGRRTDSMRRSESGPNDVFYGRNGLLRARSRDLVRNNPYAARAVTGISHNTIGTGIRPQWTRNGKAAKSIQRVWRQWGETTACDAAGNNTFYGLQALAMRAVPESGEALVVRVRDNSAPIVPFRLKVVEPDLIDTSKNSDSSPRIIQGVEVDEKGRPVAIWMFDSHPNERLRISQASKRVSLEDVAHIYRVDRPGQLRGVPWCAPILLRVSDFEDYEDAFLLRQKLANCHVAFLYDAEGSTSYEATFSEKLQPGAVEIVPPGQDIKFNTPPKADGDSEFRRRNLQSQAVGWGVTYELLSGDLSNVNFSSGRMGHLEFARNLHGWQTNMVVPQLCERVEAWFIQGLALRGETSAARVNATWTLPRREMVDPRHEIPPIRDAIRSCLMSPQRGIGQMGYDPQAILEEWAEWMRQTDAGGMVFDTDPRHTKPGKYAEPERDNDD